MVLAANAHGFDIDAAATLIPGLSPHGQSAVHEGITSEAIKVIAPDARPDFIANIVHGVENTDITHQFDKESHFDEVSTSSPEGRATLELALATVHARVTRAERLAAGNAQFFNPSFRNFRDIAAQVANTLSAVAGDGTCILSLRCPTTLFVEHSIRAHARAAVLIADLNPHPHPPTATDSPFRHGHVAGRIAEFFRGAITQTQADVDWALGNHRGRTLPQILGAHAKLVERLRTEREEIDAYLAGEELGHALHATQDFFAHSNYVELMTGTPVGTPIQSPNDPATAVPTPATFSAFSVEGLRSVMGDRFGALESGAVRTIWLGEGDFCLGDAGTFNLFNPASPVQVGAVTVRGITLFPGLHLRAVGHNPNPPGGFHYCHYSTSTTYGLNKDSPSGSEPSHRNFAFARGAAVRMSIALMREFFSATSSVPPPGPFQRFLRQTATPIGAADGAQNFAWAAADYNRDGVADLVGVKTTNTDSGRVEVHVLDGA